MSSGLGLLQVQMTLMHGKKACCTKVRACREACTLVARVYSIDALVCTKTFSNVLECSRTCYAQKCFLWCRKTRQNERFRAPTWLGSTVRMCVYTPCSKKAQDMQEAALLSQRRRLLLALYAHVAHTLTPIISPHFNFSCSFLAKSLSSREYSSTYTSFVSACLSSIQSSELYYFL